MQDAGLRGTRSTRETEAGGGDSCLSMSKANFQMHPWMKSKVHLSAPDPAESSGKGSKQKIK